VRKTGTGFMVLQLRLVSGPTAAEWETSSVMLAKDFTFFIFIAIHRRAIIVAYTIAFLCVWLPFDPTALLQQ